MNIVSAGIIPYAFINNELMFFVGHPGGCKNNYWAMLKGQANDGENYVNTAVREFEEESGVKLSDDEIANLAYLGNVKQNKKKTVHAFALRVNADRFDIEKCHSNKADNCDWDEIDKYTWMGYDDLVKCTHTTHIVFYDKIKEIEHEYTKLCFGTAVDR